MQSCGMRHGQGVLAVLHLPGPPEGQCRGSKHSTHHQGRASTVVILHGQATWKVVKWFEACGAATSLWAAFQHL